VSAHGRRGWAWFAVLGAGLLASGCAMKRIENGVYHSSKGYRVTIPGAEWTLVDDGPADLTLRHRSTAAAIAVNAICEGTAPRRAPGVLDRQLRIGLRDRRVIEHTAVDVDGRPGSRTVIEGHLEDAGANVRVESLSMQDGRCLYDLLYAAPLNGFDATRGDFARFVESFGTEPPE
jgi:hypothetical protein